MKRRDAVAHPGRCAAGRGLPVDAGISARGSGAGARGARPGTPYEPKQFTAHEWETVRVLVDLIIPKDERSGSATEAGVPEFMDFMVGDDPDLQTPVRAGSPGSTTSATDRYGKTFVACTAGERGGVLDAIAGRPRRSPSTPPAWRSSTASAT